MATDHSSTINDNAQSPAEVEQDGTRAKAHSIGDQIKGDRYAATRTAQAAKHTGLRFFKNVPPGSV